MTEQELKNMPLHDEIKLAESFAVTRVIGGWIYTTEATGWRSGEPINMVSTVFVPEPTIMDL